MAIPERDIRRIEEWCLEHSPEELRQRTYVTCTVSRLLVTISLWNLCPGRSGEDHDWIEETFARLRYTASRGEWSIYRMNRNLRWRYYDLFMPSPDINAALRCIDRDETFAFWG
ncbi:DUF3024 domain-containing protein [Brevibacterium gallinarum]|uniref:DUF3024 domain-containing protein n=1 Tax=Brevibacterium gallinarum TaxID=2762220 RepID=A0ABR8WU76_9MICO|nr:DUF3024 domain-containing protein [Brevibacterium gallinarum]MBD8020550.1 DUF3024 domain-containing protein [Brevibacterium gallinarum]